MAVTEFVPALSAIVSGLAAFYLVLLYTRSRELHYLLFAIMMADMLVGQILEFYSGIRGWSVGLYKVYYYTSPLSPALGALGVLALMGRRRALVAFTIYMVALGALLAYSVMEASVDQSRLSLGPYVGGAAIEEGVRRLSPPLTVPGGLILLLGGVTLYRRTRRAAHLLIALGALVFMIAGGLLRHGYGAEFLVLELIGTAILAYAYVES